MIDRGVAADHVDRLTFRDLYPKRAAILDDAWVHARRGVRLTGWAG